MPRRRRSDIVESLVEAVGRDNAIALMRRFGGTELYIPKTIGPHHPISAAIGHAAAQALADYIPVGDKVMIPKFPARKQRVAALKAEGHLTNKEIATETDYSERHIYRLLNPPEPDATQGDLFYSKG
jgi:DNA-binding NarL/FixJ family response regulator